MLNSYTRVFTVASSYFRGVKIPDADLCDTKNYFSANTYTYHCFHCHATFDIGSNPLPSIKQLYFYAACRNDFTLTAKMLRMVKSSVSLSENSGGSYHLMFLGLSLELQTAQGQVGNLSCLHYANLIFA